MVPNPFAGWDWEAHLPDFWQQVNFSVQTLSPLAYIAMGLGLAFLMLDWLVDLVQSFTRIRDDD